MRPLERKSVAASFEATMLTATGIMSAPAMASTTTFGDTEVTLGGYIKLDVIASSYSDGAVPTGASRDFYVPHTIPTSSGGGNGQSTLDFHAKETRVWLKTSRDIEGLKVATHLEFDFISGVNGGNELVTNAYNPALRRAFIKVGKFTMGQEWTTFQNLVALPESADFVTWPTDGTTFGRHPMIRYSTGGFDIALENPETSVLGGSALNDQNTVPDLVGRYTFGDADAKYSVAALVRQLRVDGIGTDTGAGISFAGKIAVGEKDDIKFTVTSGKGIGRYAGVGAVRDAQIDPNGDLAAIGVTNGFISYRHWWNDQWRSTVALSALEADFDTAPAGTTHKSSQTVSANLMFSPVKQVTTGVELRHGTRELENGDDGSLNRLQFSVKYSY
jgi:hypothetical protein